MTFNVWIAIQVVVRDTHQEWAWYLCVSVDIRWSKASPGNVYPEDKRQILSTQTF